jgi:hypothetical protein
MRSQVSLFAGLGVMVTLAVISPGASSQEAAPPYAYVDLSDGECETTRHFDYVAEGPLDAQKTPELALQLANATKDQAATMTKRQVDDPTGTPHVVFESHQNGKIVEAVDVIRVATGWVIKNQIFRSSCNEFDKQGAYHGE